MLNLLFDYAREHGIDLEPGFTRKTVQWAILCDRDGKYHQVVRLGDASGPGGTGREFARCPELVQGEMKAGGVIKSQFLVESAAAVSLLGPAIDQKTRDKHEYFVRLFELASETMPELGSAAACLRDRDQLDAIRRDLDEQKAKPTDKVTFRIHDSFPVDSEAWHAWWRSFRAALGKERGGTKGPPAASPQMRCFATGQLTEPAATHPKIEGLVDVGGTTAGSPLIGFNKPSYCSYGLEQSANAAVSAAAAAAYRSGLNFLIQQHSYRLAGAKVVHWFHRRIEEDDDPLPWLTEGRVTQELSAQERASELLTAIRSGRRPNLAQNRYYALTLSGASGRVMVRDWMEGQFEELVEHVKAWFDDLSMVARDGSGTLAASPKFVAVLATTVRELDNLTPPFVARMWRTAVRCEPIPHSALAAVVGRWRSDMLQGNEPNPSAAGLLKAYHLRMARAKEGIAVAPELTPYLNEQHPDAAYHCGRLMAVLAALQGAALGNVGAGVVQRYYGAASSTPALVLGRLTRTSQFHLGKLDPGLAHWYEQRLAAIWSRIESEVPPTLTLEQQSLFALGYYQQMADLRTRRTRDPESEEESHD